jgi:SHS2 domain-containing protein
LETSAGYKFLPHTTDAYIEAAGVTLEEAFAYAATALFDTICNVSAISSKLTERIHAEAPNEIMLLYDWLEALLLKFELESRVFSSFHVSEISRRQNNLILDAEVHGETFDKRKHGAKVEVKAVTLHRMEILPGGPLTVIRFILDL